MQAKSPSPKPAESAKTPLVSIVTPTFGRAAFHPALVACVASQSYPNLEWLVLDDSPEPSPALASAPHPALRYLHDPARLSVGEKRNRLADTAKGEFIVHFDDDDYYGPDYITNMMRALTAAEADFARLTGFFVGHLNLGQVGYYRTLVKTGMGFEFSRKGITPVQLDEIKMPLIHLAYGWTYLYRKRVWEASPFQSMNVFEDREFVRAAEKNFVIKTFDDHGANCMHSVHTLSSSRCFPQFRVPHFMVRALAPNAIRHLQGLRRIANGGAAAPRLVKQTGQAGVQH